MTDEESRDVAAADGRRSDAAPDSLDALVRVVSSVRHDMNNALMGLIGHLEILLSQPDLPDAVRQRAEKILGEAARLRERVADLSAIRKT